MPALDAVEAYFAPPRPRVFAHRGLALDAPENTLLAFAHAMAQGVYHLETDVHASADGFAVIAHDDDLTRVAGRVEKIANLTARELAEIDLGHEQTFVTLAEALDALPDARFNIDLKSAAAVAPTVDAIRQLRAEARVLLTSFSEARRRAAMTLLPDVATSASGPIFACALAAATVGAQPAVRRALRGIHAVQIPDRALGRSTVTPALLDRFHAAGVEVHVWTINDAPTMHMLLDAGVDGIVTDRSDVAMKVIAERALRRS